MYRAWELRRPACALRGETPGSGGAGRHRRGWCSRRASILESPRERWRGCVELSTSARLGEWKRVGEGIISFVVRAGGTFI